MFTLFLHRFKIANDCVLGSLNVNGYEYQTLEPLPTAKHPCVPAGIYLCDITYSPKFKRFLPLLHVRGRSGIRIHAGNTFRDTQGCILLGSRYVFIPPCDLFGQSSDNSYVLVESRKSLDTVMAYLKHAHISQFLLNIIDNTTDNLK